MPKKRFSPEQIIATLRQIEVQLVQSKSMALACSEPAIVEQSSGTRVSSWRSSADRKKLRGSSAPGGTTTIACGPTHLGLPTTCACYTIGCRTTATHIHNYAVGSQLAWFKIPVRSMRRNPIYS